MFDISFPELVVVGVIALLVLGPDRLPGALRTLGLWVGRMSRTFSALKTEIEREIGMDEIRRQLHNEAVMEEIKRLERDVRGPTTNGSTHADVKTPQTPPVETPPAPVVAVEPNDTQPRALEAMASQLIEKPKRAEDHDAQVDTDERPFLDHIIELRERLLKALLAVLVLFFPLYYFANNLYEWVAAPLMANLPSGSGMIATEVASPFLTPFKLSMYAAFFLAMPVILHQMWAFVSPGLYLREKRFALPLLVSSILLYYMGMAFAYYLVFPLVFKFFAGITPVGVTMMTDINHYLEFVLGLFFAFGFTFEIPIATFLIVSTGLTTTKSLTAKRPYVVVGCFIVGMILTPGPDVISQVMLAVPMWLLFELGVFFARMAERRTQATETTD